VPFHLGWNGIAAPEQVIIESVSSAFIAQERDGFVVSTDPARLDVEAVHAYLTNSYWATGISRAVVERSIAGSVCFGLFDDRKQIGFARVITDRATFAYLADVYVLDEYRGRGLGAWLMEVIIGHPDLQGLRRFMLVTRDAHWLYTKFGFVTVKSPERHMEIVRPDIYLQAAAD
jgi:GNAT superfamily N-acetyltransferase